MGIDLDALALEVDKREGDCVVTRRWLRQVLKELREARGLAPAPAAPATLDYDRYADKG